MKRWKITGIIASFVIVALIPLYVMRSNDANTRAVMASVDAAFIGSEECRDCHRPEYDKWRTSHHRMAMAKASPETVHSTSRLRYTLHTDLSHTLKLTLPFSREVASILDRLGTSPDVWAERIERLFEKTRLLGNYFCTNRERLRELARKRGVHHLDNVASAAA